MKEKLLKILKVAGIDNETASKLVDFENPTDIDENAIIASFKEHQFKLHENEPEIISKVTTQVVGRERDTFERKIRQIFDLSVDDLKDKKLEDIIKLAKAKANSGTDKTLEQLQNELLEKTNELKKLREEEIPAIRNEVEGHKKKFNIDNKITQLVSSYELRNPLEDVLASVQNYLGSNYIVDVDDKGELVVKVKETGLAVKNEDGTKFLTAQEIIKSKLEKASFLKQSNAEEGQQQVTVVKVGEEIKGKNNSFDPTKLPGYEAAKKHLEETKAATKNSI